MPSKEDKREFENRVMLGLSAALGMKGIVISGFKINENDPPDLRGIYNSKNIAVEVTQLPNTEEFGKEKRRLQFLKHAKQLALDRNLPALFISIDFRVDITRKKRTATAERLVTLLEKNLEQFSETTTKLTCEDVGELAVFRSKFGEHDWHDGVGTWVNEYFPDLLQRTIKSKEKRLPHYMNDYDENWLVVVADFRFAAGSFSVSEKMLPWKPETRFDRVFFFELWFDDATILKPTKWDC